jgi:peptidyl-prolyl cis-trans isomerase D
MLDSMRRGVTNAFTKFLLALLIVAFAVWGIGDVVRRSGPTAVATVGSTEITTQEYRQAYQDELQSISRRLGRQLTSEQAKALGIETRALARLIGFAAVDMHARALELAVPETIVASVIRGDPAFAGPTGQFSRNKFRQLIGQDGYQSEEQYIRARRRDILREQLTETLGAGARPPAALVDALTSTGKKRAWRNTLRPTMPSTSPSPRPTTARSSSSTSRTSAATWPRRIARRICSC